MDSIITEIGSFGRFQKQSCLLIGLTSALAAMTVYTTIFTAAKPKLDCNNNTVNGSETYLDTCKIWSNYSRSRELNESSIFKCEFEKKYYGSTIITEWSLVCERDYLANLAETLYMLGGFCALFSGYFGDHFGRKTSVLGFSISLCLNMAISQLLQSSVFDFRVTVKYVIYCVTQFFNGAFSFSMYTSAYVLLMELTNLKHHILFSVINLAFYCFGEVISVTISYFLKDWKLINWVMVGYSVVMVFLVKFFLPESPFWLLTNGYYDKAYTQVLSIAHTNGKQVKKVSYDINSKVDFFNAFQTMVNPYKPVEEDDQQPIVDAPDEDDDEDNNSSIKSMLVAILYPKRNFFKTALLGYIWIAVSCLYFGVSLGITSIDGINPYVIVLFGSFSEIVGYSLCFWNDKVGHQKANMYYMSTASIFCLAIGLASFFIKVKKTFYNVLMIILTGLGKCVVSGSFNTCFIYSSEFYATSVRNFALLFLSSLGCVGSLISPQINLLGDLVWNPLPFIIFSSFALFATLSSFILRRFSQH